MGLINIGEFYYMNTTLQILFYCKIFGESSFKYKNPFAKNITNSFIEKGLAIIIIKNKEEKNINIIYNHILPIIFLMHLLKHILIFKKDR